jgi:hypothetical protein
MSEFTTAAGFRKAWTQVRGDILAAHGHARDAKNIRLATGLIVLDLHIGGRWVTYTDGAQVDMLDRVRLGGTFRLRRRASVTR